MGISVFACLNSFLKNDEELGNLVDEYHGEPAITYRPAPPDFPDNYIVTDMQDLNPNTTNRALNRMIYTVDMIVDGGNLEKVEDMVSRVQQLLNDTRLHPDYGLTVFRQRGPKRVMSEEVENETGKLQWHLAYVVKCTAKEVTWNG